MRNTGNYSREEVMKKIIEKWTQLYYFVRIIQQWIHLLGSSEV